MLVCASKPILGTDVRRRIIVAIVTTVFATALIIAIPLLSFSSLGIRSRANTIAQQEAQDALRVVQYRQSQGLSNDAASLAPYFPQNRLTVITEPDGTTESFGAQPSGPVVTGVSEQGGFRLVITEPINSVVSLTKVALNIIVIIGLAMLVAFLVALRRSRTLTSVLDTLADDAARIGSGDLRPARRYGMADLDQIADSLDASSERVASMAQTDRRLVADVTHQIRTPLTAIELQLDEVLQAIDRADLDSARAGISTAHEQVDRLRSVVVDLLAVSKNLDVASTDVNLREVLMQQEAEWAPIFSKHATSGRQLTIEHSDIVVSGLLGPLQQILATLIDNALVHGEGTVKVSVRDSAGLAVVDVQDEGHSISADLRSSLFERRVTGGEGTGLGLSVARALAEHLGGRLELVSTEPTKFALFLVQRDKDGQELDSLTQAVVAEGDPGELSSPRAASSVSGKTQRR